MEYAVRTDNEKRFRVWYAVSAVICLFAVAGFVQSHLVTYAVWWRSEASRSYWTVRAVSGWEGQLVLMYESESIHRVTLPAGRWYHSQNSDWQGLPGSNWASWRLEGRYNDSWVPGWDRRYFSDANFTIDQWAVKIPYIWVALLTAVAPGYWLGTRRSARRRRRLARGLCIKCGYDLRAHRAGQRCPECGTPVPAGHAPPNQPVPPSSV
jgi:hypothetical protein